MSPGGAGRFVLFLEYTLPPGAEAPLGRLRALRDALAGAPGCLEVRALEAAQGGSRVIILESLWAAEPPELPGWSLEPAAKSRRWAFALTAL